MCAVNATNIEPDAGLPSFEKFGRQITPGDDPTKTKGLRRRFNAAAKRRWKPSKQYVRRTVIDEDVFGLRGDGDPLLTDAQVLDRWMLGLDQVEEESILERTRGTIPWITPFVREAFVKGMLRGNKDLQALARGQRRERVGRIKASPLGETPVSDLSEGEVQRARNAVVYRINQTAEELFIAPTLDPDNVQDLLQAGERARLFELEVTRTWQGITGVTAQVNTQVAAVIADGLESRATPRQLANDINDRIEKIGVTRSQMIARTETVAANNKGAVAEFAEAERLTGFDVLVQWETSLDSRVRDTHIVRHGKVFTRDEYLTLIGEPNCRCAGLPYIPAIEGEVDEASGRAARDLTPKGAKGPAKRKRKELDVPQEPPGGKAKKRGRNHDW